MKKTLITSVLATAMCAGLAAQAAQTAPPAQVPTPPAAARASAPDVFVVQGCVQPSVNAVSATPDAVGTAGSFSTATPYILTSVEKPTGTSGSSAGSAVASVYQLSADDSKLIPHVGHKVEISGTVVSSDKSTAASSAPGAAPSPTLKVENVRMIAASCTP